MTTIPLGTNAYRRTYAGEPELKLVNRFMEQNPTNLREKIALLARPGTVSLANVGASANRGCAAFPGLFNGDLFVVFGSTLYRINAAGTVTTITGILADNGVCFFTWMKGIGYQFLFISDGSTLWYYTTLAMGTLTTVPQTSGGEPTPSITDIEVGGPVIEISGVYYAWSAHVDDNGPNGTSAHPWRALLGTTTPDANGLTGDASSLSEMTLMLNFSGISGYDFSTAFVGPDANVTATSTANTLVLTALADLAAGNSVTTVVAFGTTVAFGHATLTGGGNQALQAVTGMGGGEAPGSLTALSSNVLVAVGGTQKFYWILPAETTIDPLNFASKESNPDNIVEMTTIGDQALISGAGSTENWYATGNFSAPFAPIEGRVYRRGCLLGSAVAVKDSLCMIGDDGIVYAIGYTWGDTSQYGVHRISTNGIEERIRTELRILQGLPP